MSESLTNDIKLKLGLKTSYELIKVGMNRCNLFYKVVRCKQCGYDQREAEITSLIKTYVLQNKGKCGIIYCKSKKRCSDLNRVLQMNDIKSDEYHRDKYNREEVQKRWINNQLDVIVATVAFGMGIDK